MGQRLASPVAALVNQGLVVSSLRGVYSEASKASLFIPKGPHQVISFTILVTYLLLSLLTDFSSCPSQASRWTTVEK